VKINLQDLRLSWRWDRDELRLAASRDGAYLLRTNWEESDPAKLWSQYIQLTEVEAVIRAPQGRPGQWLLVSLPRRPRQ
jgi:hypothetical protein